MAATSSSVGSIMRPTNPSPTDANHCNHHWPFRKSDILKTYHTGFNVLGSLLSILVVFRALAASVSSKPEVPDRGVDQLFCLSCRELWDYSLRLFSTFTQPGGN